MENVETDQRSSKTADRKGNLSAGRGSDQGFFVDLKLSTLQAQLDRLQDAVTKLEEEKE